MKINNELFRFIRLSRRITQRDFAKMIGISHGMVSHIETNIKPISDRVNRLVIDALELSDEEIEKYYELLNLTNAR